MRGVDVVMRQWLLHVLVDCLVVEVEYVILLAQHKGCESWNDKTHASNKDYKISQHAHSHPIHELFLPVI